MPARGSTLTVLGSAYPFRAERRAVGFRRSQRDCPDAATMQPIPAPAPPSRLSRDDCVEWGALFRLRGGAALPAAPAVERLMLAWDQCASPYGNPPIAATLAKIAGTWPLDVLDLPRGRGVGSGTSATTCTLACLSAAR